MTVYYCPRCRTTHMPHRLILRGSFGLAHCRHCDDVVVRVTL